MQFKNFSTKMKTKKEVVVRRIKTVFCVLLTQEE